MQDAPEAPNPESWQPFGHDSREMHPATKADSSGHPQARFTSHEGAVVQQAWVMPAMGLFQALAPWTESLILFNDRQPKTRDSSREHCLTRSTSGSWRQTKWKCASAMARLQECCDGLVPLWQLPSQAIAGKGRGHRLPRPWYGSSFAESIPCWSPFQISRPASSHEASSNPLHNRRRLPSNPFSSRRKLDK